MAFTRRQFLASSLAGGAILSLNRSLSLAQTAGPPATDAVAPAISTARQPDRQAVVRRHNPDVRKLDPYSAQTIGNGEFAFTADITGLQTFLEPYNTDFPLCTTAHWAWHTTPAPAGVRAADFRYKMYNAHGRRVGYATDDAGQAPLFNWLRENPHRLHLGRIGLILDRSDGTPATPDDVKNPVQTLDLWSGLLESRFEFDGMPVRVMTAVHPGLDALAVRVESPNLGTTRVRVLIAFPYGSSDVPMTDWNSDSRHVTTMTLSAQNAELTRTLDTDAYSVRLNWSSGFAIRQTGLHRFELKSSGPGGGSGRAGGAPLDLTCHFSPQPSDVALPAVSETFAAASAHWQTFWTSGAAIDLGDCTDERAPEIERRVVLSQYQTALHCAGSLPPAETGLLCNSWYGKFHLEMHWWHGVHFAAWNRLNLFEKSLGFYQRILPLAQQTAARQGYAGARWPKMVGPDGHDSPSKVGPLLVWQQPHPIYYAELCYRANPTPQTLNKWRDIVFESAQFMASYAALDAASGTYVLGPPLKTVSENADTDTTAAPTFELAYWRFGLRVAQAWRQRLGMQPEPRWLEVQNRLAPLPMRDGLYLMQADMPDTYTKWNWEHAALLGALGMQPGDGVDPETMKRTVAKVVDVWQWERAWGWDFPMTAMAAARTGQPELAIRALIIDAAKNRYHPNGHNSQRPGLTAYLPGNGGLLSAVAMMAAGWTESGNRPAPGFPDDGKWSVRVEGFARWI
jgi:hypothetical protein